MAIRSIPSEREKKDAEGKPVLNALKQWQDKVAGLQAIVDKYEANYVPVVEEPKEEIEPK